MGSRVERHPDFRQEDLGILPTQSLLRAFADRLQELAREGTRLGVVACKAQLLVFRTVIILLLLAEKVRQPSDDA